MKWVFLLLLMLNLAIFAWGYRQESGSQQQEPPLPPLRGNESLRLLSDTPPLPRFGDRSLDALDYRNDGRDEEEIEVLMEEARLADAGDPDAGDPEEETSAAEEQVAEWIEVDLHSPAIVAAPSPSPTAAPTATPPAPRRQGDEEPPAAARQVQQAHYLSLPAQRLGDGIATPRLPVTPAPPTTPYRCGILEPLANQEQGRSLTHQLRQRGIHAHLVEIPTTHGDRYEVFVPPYSNRQQANQALATLAQHGIRDVRLIEGGEQANAIALGVYSNRNNAANQMTLVARLGLPVEIKKQSRAVSVHHAIHFPLLSDHLPGTPGWNQLSSQYSLREGWCEAIASSTADRL